MTFDVMLPILSRCLQKWRSSTRTPVCSRSSSSRTWSIDVLLIFPSGDGCLRAFVSASLTWFWVYAGTKCVSLCWYASRRPSSSAEAPGGTAVCSRSSVSRTWSIDVLLIFPSGTGVFGLLYLRRWDDFQSMQAENASRCVGMRHGVLFLLLYGKCSRTSLACSPSLCCRWPSSVAVTYSCGVLQGGSWSSTWWWTLS